MRIAMWSGPRNLSTAMMYAFGARGDCDIVDEPFYSVYLLQTGLNHPLRQEVIDSLPQNPGEVIEGLLGPVPGGKPLQYQKHMSQHMIDGIARYWLGDVKNVFLIRHPARVVASYAPKRENPTLDDIGFRQQVELYDYARAMGDDPIVVDSEDIRAAPEAMLRALCAELDIEFLPEMLHWPKGGHPADGVWAKHWYGTAHRSTGFNQAAAPLPELDGALGALVETALPYYKRLYRNRIKV